MLDASHFKRVGVLITVLASLAGCAAPTPVPVTSTRLPPTATTAPAATLEPTVEPTADVSSIFPEVSANDRVLGPLDAPVTVLVYCDYQAEPCAPLAAALTGLAQSQSDTARIVYRNVPLPQNDKATLAAAAAEAAGAQGKYWEMFTTLYAAQADWVGDDVEAFRQRLSGYAGAVGLDVARFDKELGDNTYAPQVRAARDAANAIQLPDGTTAGLPGVPFIVINGQIWQGPQDQASLSAAVALDALAGRQFAAPDEVIDPLRHYTATLHTERGDIEIELYAEEAPLTVNSFVFLAEHDWFDGVTFHRVLPGQLAQAGDPSGTGYGGPGYTLPDEINPAIGFDEAGLVAMATNGPNTGGSQFFITLAPAPNLTGRYTIFGKVTAGLDVVRALTPRDPAVNPYAAPGDRILDVTIKETE